MAKTNDIIENPIIGDKLQFLVTAEDSNGELLKVKIWCKPGAEGPPEHCHPKQIETFEVVSGTAGIKINGKDHFLSTGQKATVPLNTAHKFFNPGDTELVLMASLSPALKTEFFLESVYSLAMKGDIKPDGTPKNFLQFMTILNAYYGENFVVGPPIIMQKIMAKVLGGLGKLLGHKEFVPFDRKQTANKKQKH